MSVPFSLSMEESIALPFTLSLSYSWIISRIVDEKTEFNTFIVFFLCIHMENVSGISVSNFHKVIYFLLTWSVSSNYWPAKLMNPQLVSKFWCTSF